MLNRTKEDTETQHQNVAEKIRRWNSKRPLETEIRTFEFDKGEKQTNKMKLQLKLGKVEGMRRCSLREGKEKEMSGQRKGL